MTEETTAEEVMVDEPGAELNLALSATRDEVARACEEARRFCAECHVPECTTDDLCLALDELVANVVIHGYGEDACSQLQVQIRVVPGELMVEIRDTAPAFDPLAASEPNLDIPPELRPIGGLGIHLVRSVVDEISYERAGDTNVLRLRRRFAQEPS